MAVALLAMVGCSDTWDDHYAGNMPEGGVDSYLWEVIQNDDNLSNFARVIKETGYDVALGSSQVFTVFAPTNDAFSEADADEIIALYHKENNKKEKDKRAIKEFVQNHIALFNHSVATTGEDSVVMMNGKYLVLTPEKLADSPLLTTNLLTRNGLLFTLGKKVDYQGSVFETIQSDSDLDSLGNFIASFNEYEFVASASVAGGIEDGRTWYLDSVTVLTNDMFAYTDYINSEDSVFWMVAPTNNVWKELVEEYIPYFNYDNDVLKRDSLSWVKPRLAILSGTVFNQTRNAKYTGGEYVWNTDSAVSVNAVDYNMRRYLWGLSDMKYYQYDKPFEEGGVYNGTTEVACSNGKVLKADQWNIDKTQTFHRELLVEAENRSNFDKVDDDTTNPITYNSIETWSPFYNQVSNNRYALIRPKDDYSDVWFKLPGVLSNIGYDIYVVFVPIDAVDSLATDYRAPMFQAAISYHTQEGKQSPFYSLPVNIDIDEISSRDIHNYTADPYKVDTVQIVSDYKFPTCSWGLEDYQVGLYLKSAIRRAQREDYTGVMRIDCIILKPHEDSAEPKSDEE